MSNPSFTGNITNYSPELDLIKIEPFNDVIICTQTKKINELGLIERVALWFQSHVFEQEFVLIPFSSEFKMSPKALIFHVKKFSNP